MGVSLQKGGNVNLSKEATNGLTTVTVGLGWDSRSTAGDDFDLDASAFVVGGDGNVLGDEWFIYYGHLNSPDGTVAHQGDNLTGEGDGDDEQIIIDLAKLPANAEKVVLPVTIYEAESRSQNFGQVTNAFIRIVDHTGTELTRFDLGEDFALETAVIFGELYRNGDDWKFKAVGQGYNDGLKGLCQDHGVHLS